MNAGGAGIAEVARLQRIGDLRRQRGQADADARLVLVALEGVSKDAARASEGMVEAVDAKRLYGE